MKESVVGRWLLVVGKTAVLRDALADDGRPTTTTHDHEAEL
jgi:hypothetical protein